MTNSENHRFCAAILKIRTENALSQEEFAETLGVTRQAVSRWETGLSMPSIKTLYTISEKFDVSIDALLNHCPAAGANRNIIGPLCAMIGAAGLFILPFIAELFKVKHLAVFHNAYEHSVNYLFEYPLSVALFVFGCLTVVGIYLLATKKKIRG